MRFRFLLILVLVSFVPLIPLFHSGLPVTHDGQDHVARIANFYNSLREGNVVPRWASNLNWGFGHPILMFLYPMPSYMASLFHLLGLSLVDSTKFVFGLSFIASIIFFYLWARDEWGEFIGFVGALMYGFAPYRFVDLYVRGAIGEHVAFVFIPLIFYGVELESKRKTNYSSFVFILGLSGLILSHNAISIMIIPIACVYAIYRWYFAANKSKTFLFNLFNYGIISLMLSSFFWIPAYFEGKYTLRDIVSGTDIYNRFVILKQFIYMPWSFGGSDLLSKELGVSQLIGLIFSLLLIVKIKKREYKYYLIGSISILFFSIFLMTSWSVFIWKHVSIIQKFQFPWRFLTVSVLTLPVIAMIALREFGKKVKFIGFILMLIAIINTRHMWNASSYSNQTESFYSGIYDSTTDTGESSPIWSTRFMEYRAKSHIELIQGESIILELNRTTTKHMYSILTKEESRVVDNTVYFPGWHVYIDNNDVPIQFQDPLYRGLITFYVPSGNHIVNVEFKDTKVRMFSTIISLFGVISYIGMLIYRRYKNEI